ncbi:MAG: DM13 domain-containing protein [Chloroflexi bacterium]|nr:DM13 domain-containing protein [Chloroflexota bacterium]
MIMNFIRRNPALALFAGIVIAIPVLAVGWWLASPLFQDDVVDEDIPEGIVIITPTDILDSPEAMAEAFPMSQNALIPEGQTFANAEATMASAAAQTTEMSEDMPDDVTAVEVRRGMFRDADSFHQGSGDAILFELSNGEHLLRFEDFRVTNGPDLHVYLVPRLNEDNVDIGGYVDLGQLSGNVGNQNYTIGDDIDIPEEASVVIWCEPFSVLFSVATLR